MPVVGRVDPPPVAVFGASDPPSGSPAYEEARQVGRLLGEAGFPVINGGYGGVMEGSARGARDAGGSTIGVTVASFTDRAGANPFIDREFREGTLYDRTRRLIETAAAFVVLRGGSGTLAEVAFLWALCRAGLLGPKPIVLVGPTWRALYGSLLDLGILGGAEIRATLLADGPSAAVDRVRRALADSVDTGPR
jgi:uncharacterized protein (TIGR00730 family)